MGVDRTRDCLAAEKTYGCKYFSESRKYWTFSVLDFPVLASHHHPAQTLWPLTKSSNSLGLRWILVVIYSLYAPSLRDLVNYIM